MGASNLALAIKQTVTKHNFGFTSTTKAARTPQLCQRGTWSDHDPANFPFYTTTLISLGRVCVWAGGWPCNSITVLDAKKKKNRKQVSLRITTMRTFQCATHIWGLL